jgi:hypothetical protein
VRPQDHGQPGIALFGPANIDGHTRAFLAFGLLKLVHQDCLLGQLLTLVGVGTNVPLVHANKNDPHERQASKPDCALRKITWNSGDDYRQNSAGPDADEHAVDQRDHE